MKVLWKNVLIEPIVEDVTKGGIILTKVVKKTNRHCKICWTPGRDCKNRRQSNVQ